MDAWGWVNPLGVSPALDCFGSLVSHRVQCLLGINYSHPVLHMLNPF